MYSDKRFGNPAPNGEFCCAKKHRAPCRDAARPSKKRPNRSFEEICLTEDFRFFAKQSTLPPWKAPFGGISLITTNFHCSPAAPTAEVLRGLPLRRVLDGPIAPLNGMRNAARQKNIAGRPAKSNPAACAADLQSFLFRRQMDFAGRRISASAICGRSFQRKRVQIVVEVGTGAKPGRFAPRLWRNRRQPPAKICGMAPDEGQILPSTQAAERFRQPVSRPLPGRSLAFAAISWYPRTAGQPVPPGRTACRAWWG